MAPPNPESEAAWNSLLPVRLSFVVNFWFGLGLDSADAVDGHRMAAALCMFLTPMNGISSRDSLRSGEKSGP